MANYAVLENELVNFWKLLFRSWSYFRTGYGTYLAFFIGFASNIIVIYQLEVKNVTWLAGNPIFRSQLLFALFALAVIIPLCIGAGLYHMKRTGAFAADASLSTESNPYIYKIIPGKEQEVFLTRQKPYLRVSRWGNRDEWASEASP